MTANPQVPSAAPGANEEGPTAEPKQGTAKVRDPLRKRLQLFTLSAILNDDATWKPVDHIPTGLKGLDNTLGGGLRVGGVHLFYGKTGHGKTQLVTQIAVNVARAGTPVGIISLEMPRRDLGRLIVAQMSGLFRSHLDRGEIPPSKKDKFDQTLKDAGDLPLAIVDGDFLDQNLDRENLAMVVEMGCSAFGWRLVVLDYLGLLGRRSGEGHDYAADCENSAAMKRIAATNDIALVVVHDHRKSNTSPRADLRPPPPTLDDVRGAGRIAYDATNVFLVDRGQDRQVERITIHPLKTRYSGRDADAVAIEFCWQRDCGAIKDP